MSLLVLAAAAQPADDARRTEAAQRFDRGVALFEEGNNSAALAEFLEAERLVHSPVVRLNVGLVYAAMGQSVAAVDTLSPLLAPNSGLDEAQRGRARRAVEEQSALIGRLLVTSNVVGAKIDIDNARAGVTPLEAVRVAAGSHTITASADGYNAERREILVASGVTVPVELKLRATIVSATDAPPSRPISSAARATPIERVSTSNHQVTWGWVSVVVGGLAATTGAVWLGVNAKHLAQAKTDFDAVRQQEEDDTGVCDTSGGADSDVCNAESKRVTDNYRDAQSRSNAPPLVGLGVGAAAIGVGIVLLLTADHAHSPRSALQHLPLVRPLGAQGALLSVTF